MHVPAFLLNLQVFRQGLRVAGSNDPSHLGKVRLIRHFGVVSHPTLFEVVDGFDGGNWAAECASPTAILLHARLLDVKRLRPLCSHARFPFFGGWTLACLPTKGTSPWSEDAFGV